LIGEAFQVSKMSTSPSVGQVKGSNGSSQNAGQMPSTRANEKGVDQSDRNGVWLDCVIWAARNSLALGAVILAVR
jgi:hypothetical protein